MCENANLCTVFSVSNTAHLVSLEQGKKLQDFLLDGSKMYTLCALNGSGFVESTESLTQIPVEYPPSVPPLPPPSPQGQQASQNLAQSQLAVKMIVG